MAVAFDAVGPSSSGSTSAQGASSWSWTHTAGTGGGTVLVFVSIGVSSTGSMGTVTATYGGNSMTLLKQQSCNNQGGGGLCLFGITGQAAGSNTVAVTISGSTTILSVNTGASLSFTGAGSFGTPVVNFGGYPTGDTNSYSSGSVSVSSASTSIIAGGFADGSGAQSITAGTSRYVANGDGNSAAGNSCAGTAAGTGSSVTISGAWGADYWAGIGVEVTASGGATDNGTLTTGATASAAFGGTKTALRTLSPAATAHAVFTRTRTQFAGLTSGIIAHAVFGGLRTTFGSLTANITAALAATAHGPAPVRPPENLGGTEIVVTIDGNDTLTANPYGGTAAPPDYGGGSVVTTLSGTVSETPNNLGGTPTQTDHGGTVTQVVNGGGVAGWTMQRIDLNFGEFNDIGLGVTVNNNGSPFDLTGYTVNMLLKTHAGIADSDPSVITLSSGGVSPAITVTSAVNGRFEVDIPHLDTQNQLLNFYRIDMVDPFGDINTALYGSIAYTAL